MRLRLCSPLCSVFVALLLVACSAGAAAAQCGRWISGGGVSGMSDSPGIIFRPTAVEIPGDGTPSNPSRLLVGGAFTSAGDVYANNRAYWDGARWTPFGATNSHWIYQLTHFNGSVFAIALAPTSGRKYIQRWNGNTIAASWEIFTTSVKFQIVDNDLYAVGDPGIGGITSANIVRWNGAGWTSVPSAVPGFSRIWATASYNDELVVAGSFTSIDGVPVSNIARWNGTRWASIGLGVTGDVRALTVVNGALIAGGTITSGDGVPATRITRWDGDGWQPMGEGLPRDVTALAAWDNTVVAVTSFNGSSPTTSLNRVYKWSTNAWVPLTDDFAGYVSKVMSFQDRLVVIGYFEMVGGVFAKNIAVYDGNAWSATHQGRAGDVMRGIIPMGNELVLAEYPGRVSAWNGRRWRTLGAAEGTPGSFFQCMKLWNGDLVVGGQFSRISGVDVGNIARRTASGAWEPIGTLPGPVVALATDGGELFAATGRTNTFSNAQTKVWRWNGTSWVQLPGNNLSGNIYDLAVWNGVLYAGGDTPSIFAGAPLMRWTGAAWEAFFIGTGDSRIVSTLWPTPSALYMGGTSVAEGGLTGMVSFNGSTATPIGGNFTERVVTDIARHQGAWILASSGILRQNGTTWTLAGNTTLSSNAIAVLGPEIILGGGFLTVGTMGSPHLVRWTDTGIPWIVDQPQSQNRNIGDDLELSGAPALGYDFSGPLTYQWLRDGVPVANGPGGASASGGIVSGASGTLTGEEVATLRIANTAASDSGSFTVTIANSCGGTTSAPALLHVSCRADFNGIGGVTIDDLFLYINAYFSGAPDADFNGVGGVTIDDLFLYINAYFTGC